MSSRVKNTKRNIYSSYLLMVIQMIFQFLSKSIIVYTLGKEYLGLSSLFNSILNVLNIAELGLSSSVIYCMYKPLAEGDTDKVCALLAYLKTIYRVVRTVIIGVGVIVMPFIPKVISGNAPSDINIYILYLLYLVNTGISYFLYAYKTALLTAVQRLDLTKIASCIVTVIQYVMQLVSLLYFHNYYFFVISMILGTAFINIFTAYISQKKYPQYICKGKINRNDKNTIASKVRGLMICNISIVTYKSLDSIVISAFIGLTSVGIYNNYIVIFTAVTTLITTVRSAMQSSVGDSVVSESIEKNLDSVFLWQYLFSIITTICMVDLVCLYQPFMKIWMGKDMLLPIKDVFLIGIWFLVDSVQQAYYLYLTATGLWNEMKWSYVFNTCSNLIMNVLLGKFMGITGIILASLLTCIVSGTFWQCIILFREYFKKSASKYIITQFKYFGKAGIITFVTYYMCHFIKYDGVLGLVCKGIYCTLLSGVLVYIFYCRNDYYIKGKQLFYRIIQKNK